ncbi:hypothetical protein LTR66_010527 [Elasticomyces elasticus]|nr:hypothetical protein LTR66_010527 [Elasticomyces elasticus]
MADNELQSPPRKRQRCADYSLSFLHAPYSPQDFYRNVHVPSTDTRLAPDLDLLLDTKLYPFQKRSVQWMLGREGMIMSDRGVSPVTPGEASRHSGPKGGILAEEMGLGKTVELTALICLHTTRKESVSSLKLAHDEYSNSFVRPSSTTLIVTPPAILDQWKTELNRHAPGLKVYHYDGMAAATKRTEEGHEALIEKLRGEFDVVLTTYRVLAREVHHATDPPDRSRRRARKYEHLKSPLVQILWWRVCLDEAQMVESGVNAAAKVAKMLPRRNAWCVSGTPVQKDLRDLLGLLVFLRYEPYCNPKHWNRMIKHHTHNFHELFKDLALRHTKDLVQHELALPPQELFTITLPFSAIEQQNYKSLREEMCKDIGLSHSGDPLSDDWDPECPLIIGKMRSWLARLRSTCLHPEVGAKNRKALGRGDGPLRTVAEVLEVMLEQNLASLRAEQRAHIHYQVLQAHIMLNVTDGNYYQQAALEAYLKALQQSKQVLAECREQLSGSGATSTTMNHDSNDEDRARLAGPSAQLRSALETDHLCSFSTGTCYFVIKSNTSLTVPDSTDYHRLEGLETDYYEQAKIVRRELLCHALSNFDRHAQELSRMTNQKAVTKIPRVRALDGWGGIENAKIVDRMDALTDKFNAQSETIDEWRAKVVELLLKPLVDGDEGTQDATGDEYEDSTKQQDELYAYIDALRAVIADRSSCITGQNAPLIDHEMDVLVKGARESRGHAPQLLLELLTRRKTLGPKDASESLRAIMHGVHALETSLQWQDGGGRIRAELAILEQHKKSIKFTIETQTRCVVGLEKELELFRAAMNTRLEFYRQLQQISDTVAPYKGTPDGSLNVWALGDAITKRENHKRRAADYKREREYLLTLHKKDEIEVDCAICRDTIERGILTGCGHHFCKPCLDSWYGQSRSCPTCRRYLDRRKFQDITCKVQVVAPEEDSTATPPSPNSTPKAAATSLPSNYKEISTSTLDEIKSIDLHESFGSKIDTLARHVLWLRRWDPGSKSIMFSQFRDFLDVLGTAFARFGISFARLGRPSAIENFKHKSSIECLLIDAKANAAGVTLTNATHVFLCEPLIHSTIERQAIARVHRIGQQRVTQVYKYIIKDTVEEVIESISRNTEAEEAQQELPVSTMLVHGKGGGELVAAQDLWDCLFSNVRQAADSSAAAEAVVDRHLRVEAAEERRSVAGHAE